ncbi:MAG: tyrosine-type recombinase/integrase [Shimia sp.]|uniref:tyrosine-type recombinase/integrase n=1 Tax=Shimia sp. TaxID=1954381 RepID=UPI001B16F501|nr:site-specific integrase [Shimia sp.]MBO6899632.1 tyrosine-type recombinase/integrase [Shimia sp.]
MPKQIPLVLKYDDWPQADKSAWDALFAPGGLFDDAGPCQAWSEGTRTKHGQGYGQWLSFLKRTAPDQLALPPVQRVTQGAVERYIAECEDRLLPRSTANLVVSLYVVIRAFPDTPDLEWLNTASKRLTNRAKRQSRHKPVEVSANQIVAPCLRQLKALPEMEQLSRATLAIRHRQALMIALLAMRPVRRRALLSMTVTAHLREVSDGYELRFASEDMKDQKVRSLPLPKVLVPHMQAYLDNYRPLLLGDKQGSALWINQYGDPITEDGLSRELPKITERLFGVALRPHGFRHIAATTIAEQDPEHVGIIRDLLGHRTDQMANRHYNRATGITACTQYQDVLEQLLDTHAPVERIRLPKRGNGSDDPDN